MRKKMKGLIWLVLILMFTAGCSQTSNFGQSVQEFFGFNRPTATPVPAPVDTPVPQEQQAQNAVPTDADPFGTSQTNGTSQTGGTSMDNLDWDELDPALIEPDSAGSESKGTGGDNWEDDPYAYSFSPSSFDDGTEAGIDSQQKSSVPGFEDPDDRPENNPPAELSNENQVNRPASEQIPPASQPPSGQQPPVPQAPSDQQPQMPQPPLPGPNNPSGNRPDNNRPSITFYPSRDNPVFRPMYKMPRTGFPTGIKTTVKESVTYAKTSMSISIPTLNVEENIVIVPLVDGEFPVEGLGENIGLLEGSGPGKEDLFVLAAHNHLNNQDQGPFVKLSAMKESDLIFISGANDSSRTFVVYANEKFASDDIDGLASYVKPGCMILITCEDESVEGGYLNRRVIFAEAKED